MTHLNIEDHASLLCYLRGAGWITRDEKPDFKMLAGGVSNRTVWLRRAGRGDWVLKQALSKLRVQADWFSAPERIQREAAGLRWLAKIIPEHVPAFIFEDKPQHVLAMSAVPQPHENWKTALLQGRTDADAARQFGYLLAWMHSACERHPALEYEFGDTRFFEELRLEPYYSYTASQLPAAGEFLRELIVDTRSRRLALTHGDYSPKNVLIQAGKLIILDFEVIHFGDPAFDLGFAMTHLLSKAHHLPAQRPAFLKLAQEFWRAYREQLTLDFPAHEQYALRHTCGCLLARVAGRSPLEYLDATERKRQAKIALALIARDIQTMPDLIAAFGEELVMTDV